VAGPVEGGAIAARDTAPVDDLLSIAQGHPQRTLESGDPLIVDGEPVSALFVLLDGELRVEKVGVPIAIVRERGACIGEISLLLGVSATADVVASERSVVAVVENAQNSLDADPRLPLALGQGQGVCTGVRRGIGSSGQRRERIGAGAEGHERESEWRIACA